MYRNRRFISFETIFEAAVFFWKQGSRVNGAFWHYLKRYFGTSDRQILCFYFAKSNTFENKMCKSCILTLFETIFWNCRQTIILCFYFAKSNTFEIKDCKWCILTLFETILWIFREHFENKDGKWCVLSRFDTMFWSAEKILKAVRINDAFEIYTQRLLVYMVNYTKLG